MQRPPHLYDFSRSRPWINQAGWSCLTILALTCSTVLAGSSSSEAGRDAQVDSNVASSPRWYLSVGGGSDFDSGATTFNNNLRLSLTPEEDLLVCSHSYSDIYDTNFLHLRAEVGYVARPRVELFVRFTYEHAQSETTAGTGIITAGSAQGFHFRVSETWDDYNSYSGEFGVRWFFASEAARIRPFVSIAGGATYVDRIDLKSLFFRYYDGSFVGIGSLSIGAEVSLTNHFALGVDAGLRYDSGLALPVIGSKEWISSRSPRAEAFDAGDRLYCPITLYAKFRF
jgi:hypothetical protein